MATVLSPTEYVKITDYYAELRHTLDSSLVYLYDAVYEVVLLTDFEPTLDLLQTLYDTYVSQTAALSTNSPYLNVVRALNNHVLRRATDNTGAKYADLNAYLADKGITVDTHWQAMSSDAGYTISNTHVGSHF